MSEQSKHTPGPWKAEVVRTRHSKAFSLSNPHRVIGKYQPQACFVEPDEEERANARLITAGPELLTAAKLFLERMESNGNWDDGCFYYFGRAHPELQAAIECARAAVAKAEGGPYGN